jgi:hypothetical protein
MSDRKYATLMSLLVLGSAAFGIFAAREEARTFNKFKAKGAPEATLRDALFAQLRVEACE